MVYVDDYKGVEGQKFMYHLIADTPEELRAAARNLALPYNCIRNTGKYNEHIYISLAKRNCAISQGAKPITSKELVNILKQRPNHPDRRWDVFREMIRSELQNNNQPSNYHDVR